MSKRLEGEKSISCPLCLCQGRDLGTTAKLGTLNPQHPPMPRSHWEVGKQFWELLADM